MCIKVLNIQEIIEIVNYSELFYWYKVIHNL